MQKRAFLALLLMWAVLFAVNNAESQIPSLEEVRTLPASAYGAFSAASDGYGQHIVQISYGEIQHVLVDNNGAEITEYASTIGNGQEAVIVSHAGKLRVAIKKAQQQISLYESVDGGRSWILLTGQAFSPAVDVYDLDARSDNWGTHIVWATGRCGTGNAVYYVRYDNSTSDFVGLKNVTDLPAQLNGYRPKISTSNSEAHVQFVAPTQQLYSRDLLLPTTWESNYIVNNLTPVSSVSSAVTSNGRIFCLVALDSPLNSPPPQYFYLVSRMPNETTWGEPQLVTATASGIGNGHMRNTIIAPPSNASISKVYVATICNIQTGCTDQLGITLRTYSSSGVLETIEPIYNGTTDANSVFLSSSRFGVYTYWSGFMRRKPFAIGGTITERTLLTGRNWFVGLYGLIPNGVTVSTHSTSQSSSEVTLLDDAHLRVEGVIEFSAGSVINFGTESQLWVYNGGKLLASGSASEMVVFDGSASASQTWLPLAWYQGGDRSILSYCLFKRLKPAAIVASESWLDVENCVFTDCNIAIDIGDGSSANNGYNVYHCDISGCTGSFAVRIVNGDNTRLNKNSIYHNDHVGVHILGGSPRKRVLGS